MKTRTAIEINCVTDNNQGSAAKPESCRGILDGHAEGGSATRDRSAGHVACSTSTCACSNVVHKRHMALMVLTEAYTV